MRGENPAAPDIRRAAAEALVRQEHDGYANLVLKSALAKLPAGVSARDRAFFSVLFYGTVERMTTLDFILSQFLAQPLAKADPAVRAVLRMGLYQARWMDSVPVHAAVNESVALVRRMGRPGAAGLVNAVLRRAAAFDLAGAAFADETQRLSVLYSVSPAAAALLRRALPACAEEVLAASFAQPALCVRVNTLRTDAAALTAALAAQGVQAQPGPLPDSLVLAGAGDVTALDAFAKGLFHVQGAASQLACAALDVRPGWTVLDVCAAPGGKSATLAEAMGGEGALFCCDAAENRLSLIRTTLARLGIGCAQVLCADAAVPNPALPQADAVLCDVPCSGLGVLAKKPDIRTKDLADLGALVQLQQAILETCAGYVKPGGRLLYSTCTLNPAENAGVVRAFLARHPEFQPQAPGAALPGQETDGAMVTLLPHRTHTDGFFFVLLVKEQA